MNQNLSQSGICRTVEECPTFTNLLAEVSNKTDLAAYCKRMPNPLLQLCLQAVLGTEHEEILIKKTHLKGLRPSIINDGSEL